MSLLGLARVSGPSVDAQLGAKSQKVVGRSHVSDLGDERAGALAARASGPGPGGALAPVERLAGVVELAAQACALAGSELGLQRLAHDAVHEAVAAGAAAQEVALLGFRERLEQGRAAELRTERLAQQRQREIRPAQRGETQELEGGGRALADPRANGVVNARGEGAFEALARVGCARELAGEERIAPAPGVDPLRALGRGRVAEEPLDVAALEPAERDRAGRRLLQHP